MALDLDSLLSSSNIDDEDDGNDYEQDLKTLPHRTIEEILNDDSLSSSSSSSSPPPSPKPHASSLDQYDDDDYDAVSNKLAESFKPPPIPPTRPPQTSQPDRESENPTVRVSYLSPPPPPPPSTASRQLPPLFRGIRSSAKPGAALAAAAAASRSIPTPHAAAIKSRRSTVLERRDSSTLSSSSSSSVSSFPLVIGDEVVAEERGFLNETVSGSEDYAQLNGTVHRSYDSEECGEFHGHNVVQEEGHEVESSSGVIKEERESDASGGVVDEGICGLQNPAEQDSGSIEDSNVVGDGEISEKEAKVVDETKIPMIKPRDVSRDDDGVDVKLMNEIDELVRERIEQLDSKRNSEKSEKKSHKPPLKPLELAEELERKQASTGLHLEEGAAAQPMRLEGVKRGSITLGYFDINSDNVTTRTISSQSFRRDHGLPQVLAIHLNYIGIGMSKGVVLVVPSKYSAHHVDNMDSKITMLGSQGDRTSAAVTSICFNQQGDLLLAGYSDGHITVWDLQRGSAAKVITGEHTAPVVHAFFLGQDSQVTRQFKAVTGDCNGLVLLHSFSVVPLLNRFNIKTQCLLDGQKTGTVIAASPLLYDGLTGGASLISQGSNGSSGSGFGSMMGGVVGGDASWKLFNEATAITEEGVVIFVTHQTALVVRLTPALKVYASLPRPDGVREGSMPYTAWKHMSQVSAQPDNISEAAANERVALLAIAWDRKVQVAKLVNSELKVYKKWSLDGPAIGVAWLDDQILVALTMSGQLGLFARDGTIIHQTTFALDNLGGDDLITYNTYFVNVFGNPEKAYHNTVAVRGASIYILGPMHLIVSRLLPWKERIQVLRKAGDWMGALNMAMTLYDGQAHGVIDLPRTLDAVQDAIMPYLVDLLQSYVDEVFSYISVAFCNQMGKVQKMDDQTCGSSSLHNDIKEQFTRVGGVAVEFCVHIKRTDILFDEIYSKFVAVQHRETFLELLEPYILKDMLSSLPPEIMQALVEHYSCKGWLQRVEQCVLHMDISSLDFNQVVKLCREHGLYCALVYLFNRGLDDYRSPLEELLVVYHNTPRESAASLGYRMLVYLKYCFLGLAFPPGPGSLPQSRLPSLRKELVQFLLEESNDSRVAAKRSYINLYYLLELDTEATLDVLRCAFTESNIEKSHLPSDSSENHCTEGGNFIMEEINFMVQDVVDTLVNFLNVCIVEVEDGADENRSMDALASRNEIGHLSEFIAYFVSCRRAMVSKDVLAQILQNLTSEYIILQENSESRAESSKKREKQVLSLLKAVPGSEWDADYVLHLCEKARFYQVCGFIHTIKDQDISALDSYMEDVDEPVHAFAFINDTLSRLNEAESAAFRSAVISRVPALVDLSREGTFFLVVDHFSADISDILSELQSHPKSLFLYLKTVIEVHQSGILDFSSLTRGVDGVKAANDPSTELNAYMEKISEFPKLLRNNPVPVSDDMMEHYLELLCQYDRHSVLKFLETFDSYRVEHCLRLCQEYGIVDAAAFLLERVGDVASALSLTLSSLNDKFEKLDATLRRIFSEVISSGSVGVEYFNTVLKLEEVSDIYKTLHDCIELCQRNTPRLNPEESEILWFRLLDTFCEPLMGSSDSKAPSHEDFNVSQDDDIGSIIKWRILKGVAPVLRKLFSQLIKEIVEGMIGFVRLPNIVSKLLSDNGSQEFGDFKLTILGMLGTYGFERRILDTAKSLIEDDTFYTMILLKRGASHGYAPRSPICCLCNCPLAKKSSPSGVRLFTCGHSTHIHCEILGGETSSKGSSNGCPICLPKNNQKSRNKGVLVEGGLVTKLSNKSPQVQGINNLHVNENQNDGSDGSCGLQQAPRFEILANLQKDDGLIQIENLPQLKLAPPAVYHEKVKKGIDFLNGESSSDVTKIEKPSKNRQLKEIKAKGSSIRFPLKTNIFGKERTSKR